MTNLPVLRLLADENLPRAMINALRDAGHDVAWIREIHRSLPDDAILALASEQDRVLLTGDKDFGDLTLGAGIPAATGVILIRARGSSPATITAAVVEALAAPREWVGSFTVIEPHRVRVSWTQPSP